MKVHEMIIMQIVVTIISGNSKYNTKLYMMYQIYTPHKKDRCSHASTLASFPGRSHLQPLVAANMEGEGLGDLVMCGRQMADKRGAVPDEESQSPFL